MQAYYGFIFFVFFVLTIIGIFIDATLGTIVSAVMSVIYLLKFLEEWGK